MAQVRNENIWIITGSLTVLAMVALAAALIYTRPVMIPFVLAVFIVALVSPVLDYQVLKLRIPRMIAVIVTLLIVLVFIALICVVIVQAIQNIAATASRYSDSFVRLTEEVIAWLDGQGLNLEKAEILGEVRKVIPNFVSNTFGTALGLASNLMFVSIFLIFLLSGRNPHVVRKGVYAEIDQKVRKYIGTKIIVSSATGLFVWLALELFNLELAGVFGVLAFMLNFIPSIGSIIATLLPIPIAVAQYDSPAMVVVVIGVVGTIEMIIGNGIEPKMMGKGLSLHPVVILLALSFWGLLWGIVGMFLAAPMTAIIRIVLLQFEKFRPVGRILSGDLPEADVSERD